MTSVPQAFAGVGERGLPPHRLREEKRGRAQVTHRRGKLSLHTPVTRPSCPPSRQPGSSWGSQAHTWHPLSLMQGPQPERDPTDKRKETAPARWCSSHGSAALRKGQAGGGRPEDRPTASSRPAARAAPTPCGAAPARPPKMPKEK